MRTGVRRRVRSRAPAGGRARSRSALCRRRREGSSRHSRRRAGRGAGGVSGMKKLCRASLKPEGAVVQPGLRQGGLYRRKSLWPHGSSSALPTLRSRLEPRPLILHPGSSQGRGCPTSLDLWANQQRIAVSKACRKGRSRRADVKAGSSAGASDDGANSGAMSCVGFCSGRWSIWTSGGANWKTCPQSGREHSKNVVSSTTPATSVR